MINDIFYSSDDATPRRRGLTRRRMPAAVRRALPLGVGLLALALAWIGPLPHLAAELFAAHMAMHVTVVGIAAPLLAIALAGSHVDPLRRWPRLLQPVPVSLFELVVVWAWHAPALHHQSRGDPWMMVAEQLSFLVAGFALWLSAFGGSAALRARRRAAGVLGLLMTSMHMTLLGVLLTLAPRALYGHGDSAAALLDQQTGGVLMLAVGGVSYLVGGLWLLATLMRLRAPG